MVTTIFKILPAFQNSQIPHDHQQYESGYQGELWFQQYGHLNEFSCKLITLM